MTASSDARCSRLVLRAFAHRVQDAPGSDRTTKVHASLVIDLLCLCEDVMFERVLFLVGVLETHHATN